MVCGTLKERSRALIAASGTCRIWYQRVIEFIPPEPVIVTAAGPSSHAIDKPESSLQDTFGAEGWPEEEDIGTIVNNDFDEPKFFRRVHMQHPLISEQKDQSNTTTAGQHFLYLTEENLQKTDDSNDLGCVYCHQACVDSEELNDHLFFEYGGRPEEMLTRTLASNITDMRPGTTRSLPPIIVSENQCDNLGRRANAETKYGNPRGLRGRVSDLTKRGPQSLECPLNSILLCQVQS